MSSPPKGRLKLDLFNFDSPEYETSRYILSSPRSLQACATLGIKPVELLPKSLDEFSANSSGLGLEKNMLRVVHQEQEKQRQAKLQAARRERERIIATQRRMVVEKPPQRPILQAWANGCKREGVSVMFKEPLAANSSHNNTWTTTEHQERVPFEEPARDNGHWSRTSGEKTRFSNLPEKDQRILSVMSHRLSEEERLAAMREESEWRWQREREREDKARKEELVRRQGELVLSREKFEKELSHLRSVRQSFLTELEAERLAQFQEKQQRWEHSAKLQATSRAQQQAEKKFKEEQRKKQQERQLSELDTEETLRRVALEEYLYLLRDRATTNKDAIANREATKRQFRQDVEKLRYEKKRAAVEAQRREESVVLASSIEERHARARERHLAQQAQKDACVQHIVDTRGQRAMERKMAAERIDTELREWRREVEQYNKKCLHRAEESVRRRMEERSQKTHSRREEKKREHAEIMKRVQSEEEEWRQQVAMENNMKSERSDTILRERTKSVQKARETAYATARAREHLKDQYLRNSFDRLVREAEMYASLHSKGPRTSTKTVSKVIIS